jgi:hypothetical protein
LNVEYRTGNIEPQKFLKESNNILDFNILCAFGGFCGTMRNRAGLSVLPMKMEAPVFAKASSRQAEGGLYPRFLSVI